MSVSPFNLFKKSSYIVSRGEYGKKTTEEVTKEWKEAFQRRKKNLERLEKQIVEQRQVEEAEREAEQRRKSFQNRQWLRDIQQREAARLINAREGFRRRRKIAAKRVENLDKVGRKNAQRKVNRLAREKREADEAAAIARASEERAQKEKEEADAKAFQEKIDQEDVMVDLMMRKFGVWEAIPRPREPEQPPPMQRDQENEEVQYCIISANWAMDDGDEQSDAGKDPERGSGGGELESDNDAEPQLTVDLKRFPYARSLKGIKLGERGMFELCGVLRPKPLPGTKEMRPGCCERLLELHLRYNNLQTKGVRYFAKAVMVGAVPHMQYLDLTGNRISSTGAGELSKCMQSQKFGFKRLRQLLLAQNIIEDSGAHHIATGLFAGICVRLEVLDLNSNMIGSRGAINILRGCESLRTVGNNRLSQVSLRNNKVRAGGITKLGKAPTSFFTF